MPCGFLSDALGLSYELFSGGFASAFRARCRSVLSRAETFDRSLWKVSLTSVRRAFATFSPPLLSGPVLERLLRGLHVQSLYPPPLALYFLAKSCAFLALHCPAAVPCTA